MGNSVKPRNVALIQLRKVAGISQEELAKNVGISQSALSKAEHGVYVPRFATAKRIATELGVRVDEVFPDYRF